LNKKTKIKEIFSMILDRGPFTKTALMEVTLKVGDKIQLPEFKQEANKEFSNKIATILEIGRFSYLTDLSAVHFGTDMFNGGELLR